VRNGAKVVICDLPTQEEKGQDLANRLGHDNALFIPTDVTSEEDVKNALLITKNKFKKLDITVNCAGIGVSVLTYNPKKDNPLARFHTLVLFQVS
jgi:3-hydroxyacyl-CoA dehydrogenase/3-hydroxy-2-methylbutyryl-CoA dehydrogenase